MNESQTEPIPVTHKLTRWEQWRGVVFFFLILVGSSAGVWHLPESVAHLRIQFVVALLCFGLLFDALSVFYRIASIIERRHMSGFPLIGFVFYFWAWLSYPSSVILSVSGAHFTLWLAKLLDLVCLATFHLLCHVSFAFFYRANDNSHNA